MEILIALPIWLAQAEIVGTYLATIPVAAAVVAIARKHA